MSTQLKLVVVTVFAEVKVVTSNQVESVLCMVTLLKRSAWGNVFQGVTSVPVPSKVTVPPDPSIFEIRIMPEDGMESLYP